MKKLIITVLIAALTFAFTGCASQKAETKRYTQEREEVVRKATLSNGATLLTKEVGNGVTSFSVWFKTGSRNESDADSGISHFIEHLIFKGSKTSKVNDLSKTIESLGGHLNGATSKDFTYYYFTIASKFADTAMDGMMDCLINPAFDADEIEKERKVVIEEIVRKQDNPYGYLFEKISEVSYVTHPYRRPVIGTKEIIANVSRDTLVKYYSDHYTPENMVIVVVGDFDTKELAQKVMKYFKGVEKHKSIVLGNIKADFKSGKIEEKSVFKQTYLAYSWLAPNAENPDTYALDVLSVALGQGRSSRLYRQVKENKQLCYRINASYSTMKDEGLFIVFGELEYENKEKFRAAFMEEIEKVKKEGIPQSELDKVITMIENGYIFEHETNEAVGHSLGYYEALASYKQELTYVDKIKSVKTEDVKRAAEKYLSGEPAEAGLRQRK
ncbi:MAG: pitrilysin family protein [Candidatus Firestonebacteria bacterium]